MFPRIIQLLGGSRFLNATMAEAGPDSCTMTTRDAPRIRGLGALARARRPGFRPALPRPDRPRGQALALEHTLVTAGRHVSSSCSRYPRPARPARTSGADHRRPTARWSTDRAPTQGDVEVLAIAWPSDTTPTHLRLRAQRRGLGQELRAARWRAPSTDRAPHEPSRARPAAARDQAANGVLGRTGPTVHGRRAPCRRTTEEVEIRDIVGRRSRRAARPRARGSDLHEGQHRGQRVRPLRPADREPLVAAGSPMDPVTWQMPRTVLRSPAT